ncbi:MAG: outer membrane beta-barrel protein, partial [Arcobacteraceae bacterium]
IGSIDTKQSSASVTLDTGDKDTMNSNFESADAFSVSLGSEITKYLNLELALQKNMKSESNNMAYSRNGTPNTTGTYMSSVQTNSIMISALVDIAEVTNNNWLVKPYLGLGLGLAQNKIDGMKNVLNNSSVFYEVGKETTYNFAHKYILGLTYDITKEVVLDLSYSIADYGDAKASPNYTTSTSSGIQNDAFHFDSIKTRESFISLRYKF